MECDVQEKMRPLIKNFPTVIHNSKRLAHVAQIFNIPLISTAQLPKVFGETSKEITEVYDSDCSLIFRHTKSDFSMLEKPVLDRLSEMERKKIVLYGVEGHVCVK